MIFNRFIYCFDLPEERFPKIKVHSMSIHDEKFFKSSFYINQWKSRCLGCTQKGFFIYCWDNIEDFLSKLWSSENSCFCIFPEWKTSEKSPFKMKNAFPDLIPFFWEYRFLHEDNIKFMKESFYIGREFLWKTFMNIPDTHGKCFIYSLYIVRSEGENIWFLLHISRV